MEGNTSNFYCFNISKKPFDDVRVRKAFSYAIDRTAMCEDVLKGSHVPAQSVVPGIVYDNEGNVFNEKCGDHGIPKDLSKVDEAKETIGRSRISGRKRFP